MAKAKKKSQSKVSLEETPLEKLIEDERFRLMRAHTLLQCVVIGLEDQSVSGSDADFESANSSPCYSEVVAMAVELVNTAINNLEKVPT